MGCCGSLTPSLDGLPPINSIPPEARGQRFMQPGENVECWANRTQSTDDKSGGTPPPGKIITAAVASACDLTFKQTIDAYPPEGGTITNWPTPVWSPPVDAIMTYTAGNSLKIDGKFTANDENKDFVLSVTVQFSDGSSDTKTYNLKPVKCTPDEDAITLINPMPGARITAPFNEIRPKTGGGTRAHKGLDFGNGGGKGPCVAAADGKVLAVNASDMSGGSGFTGYGYWVQIQHADKSGKPMCNTFYAHLDSISVAAGQKVAKGQQIGIVGGTGPHGPKSYTPHLHFELHIAGSCKDPTPYIQPKPPVKAGVNNAPVATGDPPAPGNSSKNYPSQPAPGQSQVETDGTFQSTPVQNENAGNAINKGTVETAGKQCAGKEEPPLSPAETPPPAPTETKPCVEMLTIEQIQKIMPSCGNRANEYVNALNRVIKEDVIADLSDPCGDEARKRVAMFLAQIGHETGNLKYKNEIWGPTAAQSRYEGRKDLGNTQPGDGYKFRGRGLIQITGRSNYEQFKNATGIDCVSNPDIITSDPYYSAKTAGWFWKTRNLNAKSNDITAATKKINGGTNGIADRERKWAAAKSILNV